MLLIINWYGPVSREQPSCSDVLHEYVYWRQTIALLMWLSDY